MGFVVKEERHRGGGRAKEKQNDSMGIKAGGEG